MKRNSSLALATALALTSLAPNISHAAGTSPVAWVSKQFGNDVAGCGAVTNPCKTFQHAHDSVVVAGGTIQIRDPGGYGPLVIKNSIAIINDGVGDAGIYTGAGDAISIQAGAADTVTIKGLVLDGAGTASNGVNSTSVGNLTIAHCTVRGFASSGVAVAPTKDPTLFTISDSLVRNNKTGITAQGFFAISGPAVYTIAKVNGTIVRTEASGNGVGVFVNTGGSYQINYASVIADQVNASQNSSAGFSVANGFLYLTRSLATGNSTGVVNGGGAYSYSDNEIKGNVTEWSAALTPIAHN